MTEHITASIDGRGVLGSGTLVVPPGGSSSITIGHRSYRLVFNQTGGSPSFSATQGLLGGALNLNDFDNPLGTHVEITGLAVDEKPAVLNLVIYAIGDSNPARVIHYTLSHQASTPGSPLGQSYAPA